MKKFYNLFIALAAVMMIAACGKDENPYQEPEKTIEISATDVVFEPEGGTGSITIASTGSVSVTSDKDWCVAGINGNTVSVAVGAWPQLEPRYAKVTLKSGSYSVNVTVQQNGFKSVSFPYTSVRFKKEGGNKDFPYNYDRVMNASSSESWAEVTVTESNVAVAAAANATTSPRKAVVDWSVGASSGSIDVWQYGNFTEQTGWTASYDGEYNYSGTYYSIVTINGPQLYDFFVGSASDLATDSAIESSILSYIDGNLAYAEANGYSVEDLYYDGADSWLYPSFNTPGEYKIVLFAVNEDYVPTGEWQAVKVKIVEPPTYADFLGKWTLKTSDGKEETWEITEDKYGSSYFISGINGMTTSNGVTLKVPATYTNGMMSISATRDLGSYTNSSGYEVSFAILGVYINGSSKYRVTPNPGTTYALATATLNEDKDKITLTPAARSSSPTGAFMGMQWYGLYVKADGSTGAYYYNSNKYTPLPQEATKVGGSGGGNTDAQYNKWIGSWTVKRSDNTDTWVISEKVKGQSYTITGIEGHAAGYFGSGNEPEAKFDAATGNLELYEQQLSPVTNSSNETVTVALYARFVYSNGTTYYNGEGDRIFKAELATDGKSATLTPGAFSYGGTDYPFVDFLYYGIVDNTVKYWWCNGVATTLPNTMTAAPASAPKATYGFSMTKNAENSFSGVRANTMAKEASKDIDEPAGEFIPHFAKVIR